MNRKRLRIFIKIFALLSLVVLFVTGCKTVDFDIDVKQPKEPAVLVHEAVTEYINSDVSTDAYDVFKKHFKDADRLDKGYPVTLSYSAENLPDTYSVDGATLILSENGEFTDSAEYVFEKGKSSIDVYHLKTGALYHYIIKLDFDNAESYEISGTFETADTPRILSVDGIVNVRDIGGWKTEDGRRVKQGLLYRGSELDGSVEKSYTLTDAGKKTMLEVLKIRSDIDLRPESDNKTGVNALGVTRTYHDMQLYGGIFTDKGKAAVKSVFTRFADENTYPAYLHCTYGTDRAGTVSYLLEALLGVSADDIMRDYQLSSLKHKSLWAIDSMKAFDANFKKLDGDTMSQKAENYLLSIGITQDQISTIRNIFLSE